MNNAEPSTTGQELARVSPETLMFFDKADDEAIVARIQGRALKECVYHFKDRGQDVYGLGIDGVEECKRELAKTGEVIREDDVKVEFQDAEYAYIKAYASRWSVQFLADGGQRQVQLDTAIDVKRQPKYTTRRDGTTMPNEFWYEQGVSKAMRNAVSNLIPETVKALIIEKYKAQARNIAPTPAQVDARVAEIHHQMEEKDERDEKVAQLKDRWREKGLMRSQVTKLLNDKGLSGALADQHISWSTVDLAVIDEMRKEAGL